MNGKELILAVDLGASKTNLGLYEATLPLVPLHEATCRTSEFPDTRALLAKFLTDCAHPPVRYACLGVPGPVAGNRSFTTNLPWLIDGEELANELGIERVTLVNDLVATAAAVPHLSQEELFTINPGKAHSGGNLAVLSPGTGLGEAFVTFDGNGAPTPHPSEGGHSDFAPNSRKEEELLVWLREILGHVSYEQVCSSLGLVNIYNFLKMRGGLSEPEWLAELLQEAADPSRVIIECSLDTARTCELCRETMRIFVDILGAESGNLTLKVMATGGVFIGGGITPRITGILDSELFLKNFLNKGRLAELLSDVPVRVIMNSRAPVLGAAYLVLQATGQALPGGQIFYR